MSALRLVVDRTELELDERALPPEGVLLLDLAEQGHVAIESSCRAASCGACMVRVLDGAEHFEALTEPERDLLHVLADPATHRLACQARLRRAGPGRCVLATP